MPTPPPTPPYDTNQDGTTGPDFFPGTPGRDRYVGLDGNDNLRGGDGDDVLIGDAGNDVIFGQNGNDHIEGGDGDDNLRGENGDDTVLGGAGDDFLRGGPGVDILDGGDGNDRISFFELTQTQGVVADLATQIMSNDGYGNSETLVSIEGLGAGTRFVDTFLGSDGVNILLGSAEDMINGRGGDDFIQVGASATGGGTINGGDGIDYLQFSVDYLADTNGDGTAELVATTQGVRVNLAVGANQLQDDGNGRQATLLNIENLGGTNFADTLIGSNGNNTIDGFGGDDLLFGLGGTNILNGGSGNDVILDFFGGNDTIDGGEEAAGAPTGVDIVSYFNTTPPPGQPGVTVDLSITTQQGTGRGLDTILNIEGIIGTAVADTISGDENDNVLWGMGGTDILDGRGGDDALIVAAFGSIIDGDGDSQTEPAAGDVSDPDGGDILAFWTQVGSPTGAVTEIGSGVTLDLAIETAQASAGGSLTVTDIEHLSGSRFDDNFSGNALNNAIGGSFGDDIISGRDGDDILHGDGTVFFDRANDDVYFVDEVPPPVGGMATGVAAGDDILDGGAGDDELVGGGGDDILTGGTGFDVIFGGDGDDTVNFNARTDGGDTVNLESGIDEVNVSGGGEVRVTFSFGRAANGDPTDGVTPFPNSDGGLAIRVQAEDGTGALTGDISRFDDEGMILRAVDGTKFDVRVLENGSPLAGLWDVVAFGTGGSDELNGSAETGAIAVLGGAGDDSITGGSGNDYINGGSGAIDFLRGGDGNDALVDGGTGNKVVEGGAGQDRFFFNITLNGANYIDLGTSLGGSGIDIVNIQGPANIPQIRLTFDVAGVGNGSIVGAANLAVEIQREDVNGNLIGAISYGEDEHILYNSPNGSVGFDIRDSGSGRELGTYSFAYLGSDQADIDTALSPTRSYFYALGGGDDVVTGGNLGDYMDGGTGADTLSGADGDDVLVGRDGNDTLDGGNGTDIAAFAKASTAYTVAAAVGGGYSVTDTTTGEQDIVRNVETLRFTDGDFNPATLAPGVFPNPSASYAVIFVNGGYTVIDRATLAETVLGNVATISFADGTFNSADIDLNVITTPPGTTSDGRNGTPNGDYIVGNDGYNFLQGLGGDDFIVAGGNGGAEPSVDQIRGNDGNDTLVGGAGADLFRGGAGVDRFFGQGGNDRISFFEVTATQGVIADLETGIISNDGFGNVESFTGIEGLGGSTRFADTFRGSAGNNLMLGDTGDTLVGRGGDDRFQLSGSVSGGGTIDGGDGYDVISTITADRQEDTNGDGISDTVFASQGVTIDLALGRIVNDGFGNSATLIGIEAVGGNSLGDTLLGDGGDNRFFLSNGNDIIDGRGGTDTIDVSLAPRADFTVFRSGPNSYTITDTTGVNTVATDVEFIQFSDGTFALSSLVTGPGPGNDYVEGTAGPDTLDGLGGNDTIVGLDGDDGLSGSDGDDNVSGGNGNDVILGGAGADSLDGGAGNDSVTGGDGSDTIIGGAGNDLIITGDSDGAADTYIAGTSPTTGASPLDLISYRTNTAGVTVSLALQGAAQNTGSEGMDTLHGFTRLEGGQGNDILTGNNQANLISGLGGDDLLDAGSQIGTTGIVPKLLNGGDGFDVAIFSGNRADYEFTYNATTGRIDLIPLTIDATVGLIGIEAVRFADGQFLIENLNIIPTAGNDVITGSRQFDRIDGLDGDDVINSRGGGDIVNGGAGNDVVNAGTAPGAASLGPDTDTVNGEAGNDTLNGGDDNDTLDGGADNDTVNGDAGNDTANGGDGNDSVNGGAGDDVLDGGAGDDTVDGGDGNDTANGGDGTDTVLGGAGNDTLNGGVGNDIVRGGDGNDSITDSAGFGGNQLFGDAGDDVFTLNGGFNFINGGTGNDSVVNTGNGTDVITHDMATGGSDSYNTGGGIDFVTLTTAPGSETRITFTSSEVGNGNVNDSNTMANQDGGLAVRIQLEGNSGGLFGPVSRGDDEGVYYTASAGSTVEVRDLVSGASRGSFRTAFLGTSGNDTITPTGEFASASLYANAGMGNDTLNGSTVADFLVGGAGDDSLSGGTGDDQFLGGAGVDTINGGEGDDIITGGAGDDAITGGAGIDTAIANVATDGADSVNLGDGNDVVQISGAGQIRLTFTSAEVGNGSATDSNTLANQDGGLAVRLQAEDGSDGLTGPVSRYDDEGITFVAAAGTTFDVRDLPTGVARGDGFRVVTLGTAAAAETLTAVNPALSYYINGGGGRDTITGGNVADFLVGGADNDILEGGQGDDAMLGGAGIDRLVGGTGNDRLDGGAGTDFLEGGTGNDVYISDGIDVITEAAEEGLDEVISSADATLAANLEDLTLVGAAINGSGNELGNIITGNESNNILRGLDGNDLLVGALGNDTLQGDNGNDVLDGGDGDDTLDGGALGDIMTGGAGNDFYQVDTVSDQVIEAIGGGTNDRIVSTVSYTLVGEVEVLNLVGAAAVNGTGSETNNSINGNDLNNTLAGADGNDLLNGNNGNDVLLGGNGVDVLRGGEGDDSLDGGAGADSMSGGNGNDLYYIDNSADVVAEVAGGGTNDRALVSANWTVAREVEVATQVGTADLSLTGNLLDNMLNGNAGNNVIRGADGNDTILGNDGNDTLFGDAGADILRGGNGDDIVIGGAGSDQLQGGAGADTFRFLSTGDLGLTGATSDRILDFSSAQGDRIDLSTIDANTTVAGNQAFSFIGSAAFSGVAGQLRVQASGTNQLVYGDVNGDGVADFLIVVTPVGAVPLAGGDFTL